MLDLDIVVKELKKFDSQRIKNEKEDELLPLFQQAMSFSSTAEIDFDVFTPELIIRLAAYGQENASNSCHALNEMYDFMQACFKNPHAKRKHYGCM